LLHRIRRFAADHILLNPGSLRATERALDERDRHPSNIIIHNRLTKAADSPESAASPSGPRAESSWFPGRGTGGSDARSRLDP
jgi:hypothetical protein